MERENGYACMKLVTGECDVKLDGVKVLKYVVSKARIDDFRELSSKVPSISVAGPHRHSVSA